MFKFLKRKPPKTTTPPPTLGDFPPLPPNHFYRVELRDEHDSICPIRVSVYESTVGRKRFVSCTVSDSTPEKIASSMHELSEKLMKKVYLEEAASQYCGDYYP